MVPGDHLSSDAMSVIWVGVEPSSSVCSEYQRRCSAFNVDWERRQWQLDAKPCLLKPVVTENKHELKCKIVSG